MATATLPRRTAKRPAGPAVLDAAAAAGVRRAQRDPAAWLREWLGADLWARAQRRASGAALKRSGSAVACNPPCRLTAFPHWRNRHPALFIVNLPDDFLGSVVRPQK